jgi:hypothetical protein
MRDPNEFNMAHSVGYAAFAGVGGMVGYVLRTMDANKPVSLRRLCVETMSAGFVGLLAMLVCNAFDLTSNWTGVIVGMSGWLGATASMRLIETVVYKRLGIDHDAVQVAKEMEQHVQDADNPDRQ